MPCTACGQGDAGGAVTKPKAMLLGGVRRGAAPRTKHQSRQVVYVRTSRGVKRFYTLRM